MCFFILTTYSFLLFGVLQWLTNQLTRLFLLLHNYFPVFQKDLTCDNIHKVCAHQLSGDTMMINYILWYYSVSSIQNYHMKVVLESAQPSTVRVFGFRVDGVDDSTSFYIVPFSSIEQQCITDVSQTLVMVQIWSKIEF